MCAGISHAVCVWFPAALPEYPFFIWEGPRAPFYEILEATLGVCVCVCVCVYNVCVCAQCVCVYTTCVCLYNVKCMLAFLCVYACITHQIGVKGRGL